MITERFTVTVKIELTAFTDNAGNAVTYTEAAIKRELRRSDAILIRGMKNKEIAAFKEE